MLHILHASRYLIITAINVGKQKVGYAIMSGLFLCIRAEAVAERIQNTKKMSKSRFIIKQVQIRNHWRQLANGLVANIAYTA